MVPLAGLEPALPEKSDFESDASTSSARGAYPTDQGVSPMDAADTDWQMGTGQYHGTAHPRKDQTDISKWPYGVSEEEIEKMAAEEYMKRGGGGIFRSNVARQLKLSDCLSVEFPDEAYDMRLKLGRLADMVTIPFGWTAEFYFDTRGYWYLQVECAAGACNLTGEPYAWKGRKWLISEHMTEGEVVQTMFKAVMTAIEHEARELFLYKGLPIFDPHYDLEKLVEMRSSEEAIKGRDAAPTVEEALDEVAKFFQMHGVSADFLNAT